MPDSKDKDSVAYVVYPLHGFVSDAAQLELPDHAMILRRDTGDLKDILLRAESESALRKYRDLFDPDYFLVGSASGEHGELEHSPGLDDRVRAIQQVATWFEPSIATAEGIILTLRLFKPGRFHTGPVYCILKSELDGPFVVNGFEAGHAEVEFEVGLQRRGLHFPFAGTRPSYELTARELPVLNQFSSTLHGAENKLARRTKWHLATAYYGSSFEQKEPRYQWIDLSIAVEGLLLQQGDQELNFRLALRAANLLGTDDAERTRLFKQVKDCYDLRSKIIHGAELKPEHNRLLDRVDEFREIVRRILLSSMGLALDIGFGPEFYKALDETALSASRRESVLKRASRLLHIGSGVVGEKP